MAVAIIFSAISDTSVVIQEIKCGFDVYTKPSRPPFVEEGYEKSVMFRSRALQSTSMVTECDAIDFDFITIAGASERMLTPSFGSS